LKAKIKTHKDLDVWKRAINLVENIYKVTKEFPKEEIYGLSSQIRRTAVSIPSNISEGAGRSSVNEYVRFLYIALGSISELETQLIIADRLKYIKGKDLFDELSIIRKQTSSLINVLKKTRNV